MICVLYDISKAFDSNSEMNITSIQSNIRGLCVSRSATIHVHIVNSPRIIHLVNMLLKICKQNFVTYKVKKAPSILS